MNRGEDLVTIGFANVAVLHDEYAESRSAAVLEWSRLKLWVSKPGQTAAVELHMFRRDGERVVLGVGRVDGDLSRLDLGDDMKDCIVSANAEGDRKLATASRRMHSESSVAGGNEGRAFRGVPGWSEVGASLEVGKEANDLGEIPLSWSTIVGASHDHCELSLEPELEDPNVYADELLVGLAVHRGKMIGGVKEIHGIGSGLNWTGGSSKSI